MNSEEVSDIFKITEDTITQSHYFLLIRALTVQGLIDERMTLRIFPNYPTFGTINIQNWIMSNKERVGLALIDFDYVTKRNDKDYIRIMVRKNT